ncbi:MAG: mRNA interferase ChpB [Methyloprofundus sp.]|nr:MAG: mRNA interferase ChpB [Methyloprofundus sp.]
MKRRPAYVISRKIFNEHTGLAIIAPISGTIRGIKLEVILPEQLKTKGAVFIEQVAEQEIDAIRILAKLLIG